MDNKRGKDGGGNAHQRAVAKPPTEIAPIPKLPPIQTDKSTKFGIRAGVEWTIGVGCLIALIEGNGTMQRSSIIALALLGAIAVTAAIFDHGWHKSVATRKVAKTRTIGILLTIWLGMAFLAYKVWPKSQIPSSRNSLKFAAS